MSSDVFKFSCVVDGLIWSSKSGAKYWLYGVYGS